MLQEEGVVVLVMQYLPVPRDVLDSRDWGRLPHYVAEKAVVIVTGTWEGAELFDRPLAYIVAGELAAKGLFPVVMSDEFIFNIGRRLERLVTEKTPFISIGNRNTNAFTALVAGEAGVDPEEYVGVVEWRGTVVGLAYGRDPFGTKYAVYRFIARYLDEFIGGISEKRRDVKLVLWPDAGKDGKDLEQLLTIGPSGLITGYGCLGGYKPRTVSLGRDIAPEGFEGEWVCCLLGCGGWGCAYRCERGGEVAVFKVPRGFESMIEGGVVPTVSMKLMERITEEANTIRALKHPNILRLYAVSTSVPILVYEYADYGSLEWQLSRGWKPGLKDVLLIAVQIGDAVRYIHSRGFLHGDIKAGNIFIAGGVAKLGDFSSLTKLIATSSSHSRFAYTPGWRAPEQMYSDLRRKAKERGLEQRIDVYQLGNLVLYMLTGETLDGEDAVEEGRVADAVKSVEHEELREVLMEALRPEPWSRPSAEEFVRKLLKVYTYI